MKLKKLLCMLISLAMILCSATAICTVTASAETLTSDSDFPAYDESKFNVTISDASGIVGDTVSVKISIANNPGIWGGNLYIKYDPKVLSPVVNEEVIDEEHTANCVALMKSEIFSRDNFLLSLPKASGDYEIISLLYTNGAAIENTTANGILAELMFSIVPGAPLGDSAIVFTNYDSYPFCNINDEVVEATYKSGVVTVKEPEFEYGDVNNDGKVSLLDLIAMRKHLAKWDITIDMTTADCNGDGKVSLLDLIALRKYLAHWNIVLGPQN